MTRGQMRTMLQRRLDDEAEETWDDSELNDILNVALMRIEVEVLKVDPEAFLRLDDADIVADQELYAKPTNMVHEVALFKKSTTASTYCRLQRIDYNETLSTCDDGSGRSSEGLKYAHWGRYFLLSPKPSESQASGLRLAHVPILSMSDDADVPQLVQPLHLAVVLYADLLARGEDGTGEGTEKKGTWSELASLLAAIPSYYRKSAADEQRIRADVVKGY